VYEAIIEIRQRTMNITDTLSHYEDSA